MDYCTMIWRPWSNSGFKDATVLCAVVNCYHCLASHSHDVSPVLLESKGAVMTYSCKTHHPGSSANNVDLLS